MSTRGVAKETALLGRNNCSEVVQTFPTEYLLRQLFGSSPPQMQITQVCFDGALKLRQWKDYAQCLRACKTFPLLNDTASTFVSGWITADNSLPCRKYHAGVAGSSVDNSETHCVHAGPLGGYGTCGTECEGLCNLVNATCPSITNCMAQCSNLVSSNGNTTTVIIDGKVPRGTVGCVTFYALKALGDSSACPSANAALNMTVDGAMCLGSSVALVKASWAVIAVLLLALCSVLS